MTRVVNFYSRFWQRSPSGKHSLPVPLSGSLPQSSGNNGSFPVATGATVPSSMNFGPKPIMFWIPDTKGWMAFCIGRKKFVKPWKAVKGNWPMATGKSMVRRTRQWSLMVGVHLLSTVGELHEDFGGGANTGSAGGDLPWRPRLSKGGGRGRSDLQGNLGLWRRKLSGVMPSLNELHLRHQSQVSSKERWQHMIVAKG